VGEVAAARGRAAFDTLLDISLADGLRTVFRSPPAGDDPATWELRSRYWGDRRTLIGGSDAGAHLDTLCNAGYTSDFLGKSVRDRGLLPLERAVQLITDLPARLFGLDGRGRIAEGCWADLVAFDPTTISQDSLSMRTDLPGGASRLFCNAVGIRHVLVNGVEIVDGDQITGALPGTVLRSGRQVSTVTAR
jgi:N-acyl-D-aspartate/D-glutamate deacylase